MQAELKLADRLWEIDEEYAYKFIKRKEAIEK